MTRIVWAYRTRRPSARLTPPPARRGHASAMELPDEAYWWRSSRRLWKAEIEIVNFSKVRV